MKDIITRCQELYTLKSLVRFNTHQRIKDENVLEHTSMVSLISLLLSKKFKNVDESKLLKMSLIHDLSEIKLGEFPFGVKASFSNIKEALKLSEHIIMKQSFSEFYEIFNEYEIQESLESKLVKLSDIVSVLLYTSNEVNLGNRYMKKLLSESIHRFKLQCSRVGIETNEDDLNSLYRGEKNDK